MTTTTNENQQMNTILVFDMSNILYKTFYVNSREPDPDILVKMAFHASLTTLNKYFKLYNPYRVVFAFDRSNWRAEYTKSEECYSQKIYKGHRRQSMTPKQKEMYGIFKSFMGDFEQMIRECTSIICLAEDMLEADDIMAGICRIYGGPDTASDNGCSYNEVIGGHEVKIISADRDMMQLLRYKHVEIVDPANGNSQVIDETNYGSVEYYLYEKSMIGDPGDNVQSAFPRFRKKKIQEAFDDAYKHTNLMNETWTNVDDRTMVVGELFKENKLLTNLTHQPEWVQDILWSTITEGFSETKKFNQFKFLKFLGKYELKNISKYLDSYIPMLSR